MITVKKIWFSYENYDKYVLEDLSFSVEKGKSSGYWGRMALARRRS